MYHAISKATDGRNRVIDLRSDTVTRPSPGMRQAMAEADVGDDVYGEDPTIIELERRVADLFGKEAALLLPSGTQSNLAALLSHCGRGEEFIVGDCYHSFAYEAGGASALGGIVACPLATDENGGLDPEAVAAAIKPDDSHFPVTKLLSLENTVSGQVQSPALVSELCAIARRNGLRLHLDGARVWNAATALGLSLAEVTAEFDSVSACLSKGLGAPAGSVLSGSRDFIAKARRARKMLGGGMRQAGLLAACGLYALDHVLPILKTDHEKARRLAAGLQGLERLGVVDGDTNMIFLKPRPDEARSLVDHVAERGVLIGSPGPSIRVVLHQDVLAEDIEPVAEAIRGFYQA